MIVWDWADELANRLPRDEMGAASNKDIAAALRKAKADGWRECSTYLFVPDQGESVVPTDAEAWHACHLEALKIEKGEA